MHANLDLECTISDLVTSDGTWNLDLFHMWLPEEVIQQIVRIPPPHPLLGLDRIILTNLECTKTRLGHNNSCSFCGHEVEDIFHVLQDRSAAKEVCTPFEVEPWGILDGLLILLNKGYKRVTIQTDNSGMKAL
ncbi:hypothetical protein J1N35_007731 [Gossypium stocksii]|uniref:RNase H type-1 domain-containing protein n=1 Tax=Gossypium stocksii TaxID=47602 RepID=A0A9D3W800_9ROSI|nr:hypothetical protein J1N35_007731 [Gossypium stocksii]